MGEKASAPRNSSEVSVRTRGGRPRQETRARCCTKNSPRSTGPSKGDGGDLSGGRRRGTTRAHTHTHTGPRLLKNAGEGKGDPGVKHQSTSVHPGSKVRALLFFHLLPTARRGTFEAVAGWYGSASASTKFVYTYSTIHQSAL